MSNANNNSETGGARRVLAWLSDYAWLLAGCLFVLIAVKSNADRAEDPDMVANRKRIEAMARTERERLRHNETEFLQLDAQDERRVRDLHEAVCENEKLEKTLDRWHNWLATLPLDQREKVLGAKTPQERMEIVRRLRQEHGRRGGWQGGHMPEAPWSRSRQPTRFRPEDFKAMLRIAAKWCELSAEPEQSDPRSVLAHHILIVTTLLDETFPNWDEPPQPNGPRFGRGRPEIPEELRRRLISSISDDNIRRMFTERVEGGRPGQTQGTVQSIVLFSYFARGLFEETRRIVDSEPLSEDDRLAIYLKLPEQVQKELDRLPRDAFNFRIQWIAMRKSLGPDIGGRLERLTQLFDRLNNRRPGGGQNPGRRGDDNEPRGDNRPPGRPGFGQRPPGGPQPGK